MKAALIPALAASLTLAACASSPDAPRTAPAAPVARPTPPAPRPAAPPQAAPTTGWMDVALSPGAWRHHQHEGGTTAFFIATTGAGGFLMTCDPRRGRVELWREGKSSAPRVMTIRTETATRSFQAVPVEDTLPYHAADVAVGDPLLDAMA
ncbi:MAG: hypothetical protein CFE32_20570, partial [Alphaproteobacteria bacterium PA3]